jgi:hypothetical protein
MSEKFPFSKPSSNPMGQSVNPVFLLLFRVGANFIDLKTQTHGDFPIKIPIQPILMAIAYHNKITISNNHKI